MLSVLNRPYNKDFLGAQFNGRAMSYFAECLPATATKLIHRALVFYFRLVPIPNCSHPINCFLFVKHQRSKEVDHLQRSGTAVMRILEKELFCFGNQFFSFLYLGP